MKKSRIHVLIIEDDPQQGRALKEAFSRSGFSVSLASSSAQGVQSAQRQEIQVVIADCMLPKINGVDTVMQIKKHALVPPKIFLISGIFKDKNFIKSSISKTGAEGFYAKPLDLKQLTTDVELAMRHAHQDLDPALLRLYREAPLSADDLREILTIETTLHSVHLPMLYKRMQETDASGELTMITENGDLNSVSFHHGRIFDVRTPDRDTYFGSLAVGFGFVSAEEVMAALREPSAKLLGQRLIDSMSLSPHAISVIMGEQLALRLSQTVQSGVANLHWNDKRFTKPHHVLDGERFDALIADWMRSKINPEWIQPFLTMWGTYKVIGHYHSSISDVDTINDLMAHPDFAGATDILYFFRQLILGNASLGERGEETRNFNFLEHRLNQLLSDFKAQNFFQILGVGEKAQTLELNRSYNELKAHFSPAALPEETPPALRVKATKVFQQIEQAYTTLSDDTARGTYLMTLQNKRAQTQLENEPVFRAAVLELQGGQAAMAMRRFESLMQKRIEFRDLRSYYIWAGLKTDKHFKTMTLDQVPPEERHSAPYLMAKGVWHRQRGQISKSLEAFRTAHLLDPRLTIARKELEELKADLELRSSNRTLLREVNSVVEGIIGNRKRGA